MSDHVLPMSAVNHRIEPRSLGRVGALLERNMVAGFRRASDAGCRCRKSRMVLTAHFEFVCGWRLSVRDLHFGAPRVLWWGQAHGLGGIRIALGGSEVEGFASVLLIVIVADFPSETAAA
jgi:hypothetical protein